MGRRFLQISATVLLATTLFGFAQRTLRAADVVVAPTEFLASAAKETQEEAQPLDKIYVASYAMVGLMIGLGVLVVCQTRERAERPELRQEDLMERLRVMYGQKQPPA